MIQTISAHFIFHDLFPVGVVRSLQPPKETRFCCCSNYWCFSVTDFQSPRNPEARWRGFRKLLWAGLRVCACVCVCVCVSVCACACSDLRCKGEERCQFFHFCQPVNSDQRWVLKSNKVSCSFKWWILFRVTRIRLFFSTGISLLFPTEIINTTRRPCDTDVVEPLLSPAFVFRPQTVTRN